MRSNYVLQRTPGTSYVSTYLRGPAPLNTALARMLALMFSLLLAAPEAGELRRLDDYSGQAGDMWLAAGEQPLSMSTAGNELRVWAGAGVTGIWTGWIVTPSRVRVFSNEIVVGGIYQAGGKSRQVASQRRSDARGILRRFGGFARLDGVAVTCPFHDGIGYLIEGRRNGAYFAFAASNPKLCSVPHAQEVAAALELLWAVREDAL